MIDSYNIAITYLKLTYQLAITLLKPFFKISKNHFYNHKSDILFGLKLNRYLNGLFATDIFWLTILFLFFQHNFGVFIVF